MELKIQSYSSRSLIENIDSSQDFSSSFLDESKYYFWVKLDIFLEEKKCAVIEGYIYDVDKITDDQEDIADIADSIDGDNVTCIFELKESDLYKEEFNNDYSLVEPFIVYMSNFFIYPDFRNKGLGSYLLDNLFQMFRYCFNINTHCIVTFLKPQTPTAKGWIDTLDENDLIVTQSKKVLRNCGFRQIGLTSCYAINYFTNNDFLS